MSAAQIINELPKLSPAELDAVRRKLEELASESSSVVLRDRHIDELQAADLRSRLNAFAEDWNRSEDSIYDKTPPR